MLNDHKYFALFIYILWFNVIFWSYTQQPLTSACNVPSSCTPLNVMPLSCCQEMLPQSFENSAKLKFFPKLSPLLAKHLYISCSKTILCVSAWFYRSVLFNAGLKDIPYSRAKRIHSLKSLETYGRFTLLTFLIRMQSFAILCWKWTTNKHFAFAV